MDIDVDSRHGRRADHRWDRTSVGDVFERLRWSAPDKEILIAREDAVADPAFARVTPVTADATANRIAQGLLDSGLRRGDAVAMFCENSVEAVLTKIGIAKAGGVALPINTLMAADMVADVLARVSPQLAIVDADGWSTCGETFTAAGLRTLASIRGDADPVAGSQDFAEWTAGFADTEPDVRIHGDDLWEILPTSGTTAMPKAVMVSHHYTYFAALAHALSYTRGLAVESDLRICTFLPIVFHIGDHAYVFASLLTGGSTVLGRRLEHTAVARAITDERVTCLWGGSPQFISELVQTVTAAAPGTYDLTSLTVIVYGWAALHPSVVDELQRLCDGVELVGIFGQTEAIACHRWLPLRESELHAATAPAVNYVGRPVSLLGADVVDVDGASLRDRPGEVGEAVYRTPAVTQGYLGDATATDDAFRGGWFHSGDLCAYDEHGNRIMLDRAKDIVKSGGENVSSIRVEAILAAHPSIARAAVVGIPDDRWGEAVVGCVVLAEGATLDSEAVIAFCRERLAGYETPKRLVAFDDLPATVGGKVLKYRLREMLADG